MAATAQPLNFGNDQMAHSGPLPWKTCKNHTFAAIRFLDFRFWWLAILWLFFFWKPSKRYFLSRSGIPGLDSYGGYMAQPLNFGNDQMAHSGPLPWTTCKNHTFAAIRILDFRFWWLAIFWLNFFWTFFKKRHFLPRSGIPGLDNYGGYGPTLNFGTIRWHILGRCNEKHAKTILLPQTVF